MQPAYENLYKYRWQLTVIITYKIGILLDVERAGSHHHTTPLPSRRVSIFSTLAMKVFNVKRTFVPVSARGKATSNISPGY